MKRPAKERFWEKVSTAPNGGCWTFRGAPSREYIMIRGDNGVQVAAHRFSYELHFGAIPKGLWVLHKCDNTKCVNPDHLFLGTHEDNMADMVSKGRSMNQKGELNHNAKLSADDVRTIRLSISRGIKQRTLAKTYGVSENQIKEIKLRRKWNHV